MGCSADPIVTDKVHYFVSYEYERQPGSVFVQPARLPAQEWVYETPETQNSFTARVDHTVTDNGSALLPDLLLELCNGLQHVEFTAHPSNARARTQDSGNALATWTRLWNNDMFTELKLGYNGFEWTNKLADYIGWRL